jgi:hypothetical protein
MVTVAFNWACNQQVLLALQMLQTLTGPFMIIKMVIAAVYFS